LLVISAANAVVHNGRGIILGAVKAEEEEVAGVDDTVEVDLTRVLLLSLRRVVVLLRRLLRLFDDDEEDATPTAAVNRERERDEDAKDAMEPTEVEGVIMDDVDGVVLGVTSKDGGIENSRRAAAAAAEDRCGCGCGCSTLLGWWLDHCKFLWLPCIIVTMLND